MLLNRGKEDLPLEADTAVAAADTVGDRTAGLLQIGEEKGLALDDEAALKTVVGLQTRGDGGDDLELQVAQIADAAEAAGLPRECQLVAGGQVVLHVDVTVSDGIAGHLAIVSKRAAEGIEVSKADEAGQRVERPRQWRAWRIDIAPDTLKGGAANGLAKSGTNMFAQLVEVLGHLHAAPHSLVNGTAKTLDVFSRNVITHFL